MYKNFEELFLARAPKGLKHLVVAWANEDHTLEAVGMAAEKNLATPILVGDAADLATRVKRWGLDSARIVHADNPQQAVDKAIALCRSGEGDALLKGMVDTAVILRAVVNKQTGLTAGGTLSHCTLVELPTYHKLIAVTDCALLTYPNLDQKMQEIKNAVTYLNRLGISPVRVAVLAAIEKINPHMPETVDADALKQWGLQGGAGDAIVEGPISYDVAMRPGAAQIKGFQSAVAGDPDLLVVPNITCGNILIKALTTSAGGVSAGLILGATIPIVISSRSSSTLNKFTAIRMALSI